jgi:hypothetical protein
MIISSKYQSKGGTPDRGKKSRELTEMDLGKHDGQKMMKARRSGCAACHEEIGPAEVAHCWTIAY